MSEKYYLKSKKIIVFDKKKYIKGFAVILLITGFFSIAYFLFPLISYQLFIASASENNTIETPIPKYLVVKKNGELGSLFDQGIKAITTDFTDARNWYPNLSPDSSKVKVDSYFISIPKLKIAKAEVSTKDYDLSQHLVQYFGTSIPGENGTAVVFGHSTLPQLFSPDNYKTIFATAHTLKLGDEIYVTIGNLTYKYKIFAIDITSADDENILAQSYDNSYLTLVTCTPPGTVWKRLVIRASLEKVKS